MLENKHALTKWNENIHRLKHIFTTKGSREVAAFHCNCSLKAGPGSPRCNSLPPKDFSKSTTRSEAFFSCCSDSNDFRWMKRLKSMTRVFSEYQYRYYRNHKYLIQKHNLGRRHRAKLFQVITRTSVYCVFYYRYW